MNELPSFLIISATELSKTDKRSHPTIKKELINNPLAIQISNNKFCIIEGENYKFMELINLTRSNDLWEGRLASALRKLTLFETKRDKTKDCYTKKDITKIIGNNWFYYLKSFNFFSFHLVESNKKPLKFYQYNF